jgi:hypothetical protein
VIPRREAIGFSPSTSSIVAEKDGSWK